MKTKNPSAISHKLSAKVLPAFTLIELLVVISIIGILIAIVSSSFITAQKQTRDSRRKGDLEQIRQALETFRSENGSYPTPDYSALSPDYVTTLPTDPSGGIYAYSSTATTYNLCAALELEPASPDSCGALDCGTLDCNYRTQNP